jgi:hypothetical protein
MPAVVETEGVGDVLGGYFEVQNGLRRPFLSTLLGAISQVSFVGLLAVGVPDAARPTAVDLPRHIIIHERKKIQIPPRREQARQKPSHKRPTAAAKGAVAPPPPPAASKAKLPRAKPRWEMELDLAQQLPIVLAKWNGSLVFGLADEPGTYRVALSGPEFRKVDETDAAAVNDRGLAVTLPDSDRWSRVRQAREGCSQCQKYENVWAVFPHSFFAQLMSRLDEASSKASPTALLLVRFDAADPLGISVREAGESTPAGELTQ